MSLVSHGRRGLFALAVLSVFAAPASAQIARMDPKHCRGQPEIKPLEALQVRTDRGVTSFMVEVADSEREREYGLMCRRSLPADRGMLFLFPKAAPQMFWMRNTLIPLDIIYIGENGRVVSISRNVQPLDESGAPSAGPAKFVLELAAGRAAQIGLLPGDRVLHRALPHG
ncbi:DUF192 domain-containing protein [Phenylobacterium kunshanense]|uniref:DUF192 domain-containing protein n=1 Tax=Phenylobacterium kunshanense TaxID=1445034 RepID=A0A328BTR4_9CAUL|nr:DUF192 domain-containing protein [Phenylobacterium kunshanense]RAK69254.1 DUF192 domain-containing protein [Phenylobacterium kunshanense]